MRNTAVAVVVEAMTLSLVLLAKAALVSMVGQVVAAAQTVMPQKSEANGVRILPAVVERKEQAQVEMAGQVTAELLAVATVEEAELVLGVNPLLAVTEAQAVSLAAQAAVVEPRLEDTVMTIVAQAEQAAEAR